ncbi:MAG: septal ring lytic transglycosylase RlpA family protein [Prevotella sp.]|nr:septal ring lytic transglycosylase RlpA family protein [Prevotella sp.]MDD7605423.1 septal ring lytic transglycosylase RlpA family protein [Prevotellaceae bacterium]MDY3248365.1 septal ring lytic transglycosylase RlpA family protein [Prevotella sp.]
MRYVTRILFTLLSLCSFTLLPAQTQRGKATFYSKRSTGARTASGARLHHDSLTCAHRTYPFGTLLKVTNLNNGKSVVVKVTDRGPFARGRIIDLSWRAAKELDILSKGVSTVKVEVYNGAEGIPYRRNDGVDLPEIDFEITEAGYSFADNWKELSKKSAKERPARRPASTKTHSRKAEHKSATPKKSEEDKKDGNMWSNIFDNIKKKSSDLF